MNLNINQRLFQLDNSLRVFQLFLPYTNSVNVSIMVNVGSKDENPDEFGIAHFVEHMLGESTNGFKSEAEKQVEMETLGIYENAWTSNEYTNYYYFGPQKNLKKMLEIIFDKLFYSKFKSESIQKQKKIICEELKMRDDDFESLTFETGMKKFFNKTGYAHSIGGTVDSVKSLKRSQIENFYRHYYRLENCILVVSGNVSFAELDDAIQSLEIDKFSFKSKKFNRDSKIDFPQDNVCNLLKKDSICDYIVIGSASKNYFGINRSALFILSIMLGFGKGSLFYQQLITKNFAIDFSSSVMMFKEKFLFYIFLILKKQKTVETVKKVLRIIQQGEKVLTLKNFLRSKKIVEYSFNKLLERSNGLVNSESYLNPVVRILNNQSFELNQIQKEINLTKFLDVKDAFKKIAGMKMQMVYLSDKKLNF